MIERFKALPSWARVLIGLFVLGILIGPFVPEEESAPAPEKPKVEATQPEVEHEDAEVVKKDCLPTSAEALKAIGQGLEDGLKLKNGWYLAANNGKDDFFYVAAELHGPGIDGEPTAWAVGNEPFDGNLGFVAPADGVADEFSDWGDAGDGNVNLSGEEDVETAIGCLS